MNAPTRLVSKTLAALLPIALIVAWAFANFMYSNRFEDFLYSQLAQYYLFMTLAFVVPVALGMLIFPAQRRAIAVISYLGTATLFLLPGIIDAIGPAVRQRYIIGPVLMVAALAGLWIQQKLAGRRYVRGFAIAFLLLTTIPMVQLAVHQFTISDHQSRAEVPLQGEAVRKPNVYFILLDAYARADQLKSVMGFDNGPFLKALENQGVFVANKSFASYPATTYSITTTFRMAYASGIEPAIRKTLFNSATFRNFRRLGYRLVHIPQMQDQMRCPDGIECFFDKSTGKTKAIGYLGINLLGMLPALPTLVGRFFPALHSYTSNEPGNLLAFLKESPPKSPTFIYAHFDMPHPRYLRDSDCNPTPPSVQGNRAHMGWGSKDAYLGFLQCGNKKVLEIVRYIVKNDPDAIIILQSDHGSYFRRRPIPGERRLTVRKGERWYIDALEENFGTLNAWRLPEGCREWLSPDLSPINTFRLVFGCLTNSDPQFLPNRSFWVDEEKEQLSLVREKGRWIVPGVK